jgi:site-specific recombinase XerD
MIQHNSVNERVKRRYFLYLREARRQSEPSVDAAAKALARFEAFTGYRDFKAFHFEQAVAFKRRLGGNGDGERLSKATFYATFAHLKRFFTWLAEQSGYRSKLRYGDEALRLLSRPRA